MADASTETPLPPRDERRSVLVLDNIEVDLPTAGLGSRALAVIVDYLIVAVIQIVVLFAAIVGAGFAGWSASVAVPVVVLAVFLVDWGYFAGCEALLGGRTPGKAAVKLRVVGRTGADAPLSALLARNLLRLPDLLLGIPLIALDPLDRRLGDRFAGTVVVHESRDTAEIQLRRVPDGWSNREIAVTEALLERADQMDPCQREHLARRLLQLIATQDPEFIDLERPDDDPIAALRHSLRVTGP